jgi:(p)ppGpp synthase/HD superfamily hydrolase
MEAIMDMNFSDLPSASSTEELVSRARAYAIGAHTAVNQAHKRADQPYWRHPEAVAAMVARVASTDEMVAAAWLHDVVEGTAFTLKELQVEFGIVVANYVERLTDTIKGAATEADRFAERTRLSGAPWQIKTIKLADLIDNCRTVLDHEPKEQAEAYLADKARMIAVVADGNAELCHSAVEVINAWKDQRSLRQDLRASAR